MEIVFFQYELIYGERMMYCFKILPYFSEYTTGKMLIGIVIFTIKLNQEKDCFENENLRPVKLIYLDVVKIRVTNGKRLHIL